MLRVVVGLFLALVLSTAAHAQTPVAPQMTQDLARVVANAICIKGRILDTKAADKQAQIGIALGWQKVQRGEGWQAVSFFLTGTTNDKYRGDALWGMAVAAHVGKLGPKIADACFNRAYKLLDGNSALLTDYAKFQVETGHPDGALPVLLAAVKLDPKNAAAHSLLANIYKKFNRPAEAEKHAAIAKELQVKGYKPSRR